MYWNNSNISMCLAELQTIRQVYWSRIVNLESVAYDLERRCEIVKMEVTRLNTHTNTQIHRWTRTNTCIIWMHLKKLHTHMAAACGSEWKFYIRFESKMTFDWIGLNNWWVFDIVCWAGFLSVMFGRLYFKKLHTNRARTTTFKPHTHILFFFHSSPHHTLPHPAVPFFVLVSDCTCCCCGCFYILLFSVLISTLLSHFSSWLNVDDEDEEGLTLGEKNERVKKMRMEVKRTSTHRRHTSNTLAALILLFLSDICVLMCVRFHLSLFFFCPIGFYDFNYFPVCFDQIHSCIWLRYAKAFLLVFLCVLIHANHFWFLPRIYSNIFREQSNHKVRTKTKL